MRSRLVSTAIALSVLVTSSGPASAQQYIYRFKVPLAVNFVPGEPHAPDEEIAPENDVVAYFAAAVGEDFAKAIPVETTEVVEWRLEGGDSVPGLQFDYAAGDYSGKPTTVGVTEQLVYGYNSGGVRIARARLHFTVFKLQGVRSGIDFYAHTGQYFFADIPTPADVDVYRWEAIPGLGPIPGMDTRASAFEGVPTAAGTYPLVYQGYDVFGNAIAYAEGNILVEHGPTVADITDQEVDKQAHQVFDRQAAVARSIGTLTYKLVAEDVRPSGLTFDSTQGKVGDVYDEFETSASFRIEATDTADGTKGYSNWFKLSTLPADLDPDKIGQLYGRVGKTFTARKLVTALALPGTTWEVVEGTLPDGIHLSVDPDTSDTYLLGTPLRKQDEKGIVLEAFAPGVEPKRTAPFAFHVYEQDLNPKTVTYKGRTNAPIQTAGVTLSNAGTEVYGYELLSDLPSGFGFDPATGVISSPTGVAKAATYSFPMRAVVAGEPRTGEFRQYIDIRVPLTLSYTLPGEPYRRNQANSLAPTYDAAATFGAEQFKIVSGALPDGDWLTFDKGRFAIRPTKLAHVGTYGPFTVSLNDEVGPAVNAVPFSIVIADRNAPEPFAAYSDIQRLATNYGRFAWAKNLFSPSKGGSYSFRLSDNSGPLPTGIDVAPGGYLTGTTSAAAGSVWPGIYIEAKDAVAGEPVYTGTNEEPITVTVVEPKSPRPLDGSFDKTFDWPVGVSMAMDMPKLLYALGKVTYTLTGPQVGDLAVVDGKLTGTVNALGTYGIAYDVKDDTARPGASGRITLNIIPKMSVTAEPFWDAYKSSWFSKVPQVVDGIAPITYALLPQSQLPESGNWRMTSSGEVQGMPMAEEANPRPISIEVKDAAGVTRRFDTHLRMNKAQDFTFSYPVKRLNVGEGSGYLLNPKVTNGTKPIRYGLESAEIPGLKLSETQDVNGQYAGSFSGTPTKAGVYEIAVTATDANGVTPKPNNPVKHEVLVGYAQDIAFSGRTFRHRVGKAFTQQLPFFNAVSPVFSPASAPLPYGLYVDGPTGILSGRIDDIGTFGGIDVTLTEDQRFGRAPTSASFGVETVAPLELTVPADMNGFKQYVQKSVAIIEAKNVIGDGNAATPDATYIPDPATTPLPDGLVVNPATGAVEGVPTKAGTTGPHRILIVDSYGDQVPSNDFTVTVGSRDKLELTFADGATSFRQYEDGEAKAAPVNAAPGVIVYSVDRPLPAGVTLEADGTIRATSPLSDFAEQTFTVTATDSTFRDRADPNGKDEFPVKVSVARRPQLSAGFETPAIFTRHVTSSAAATTANPIVYGEVQYDIVSGMPSGLDFDGASLVGETTDAAGTYTATVRATDATFRNHGDDRGKYEFQATVTVSDRPALSASMGEDPVVFKQYETAIGEVTVGNDLGPLAYTVTPGLPDGVLFDGKSLKSEEPPTASPLTDYAVHIEDGKDGKVDFALKLQVQRRPQMVFDGGDPIVFQQHHEDSGKAPTPADPSYGAVEYSIDPTPPSCITFSSTTGAIGTAGCEDVIPVQNYTVTAADATYRDHGDGHGKAEATVDVSVRKRDQMTLSYPEYDQTQQSFGFQRHKTATAAPKPENGLTQSLVWNIVPALPAGLSFDYDTGIITAGSDHVIAPTEYTVRVEDGKDGWAEAKLVIGVRERDQLKFETALPQEVPLNQAYELTLNVKNVIGDAARFEKVSGDLPTGISFDADGTGDCGTAGTFCGTPDVADHGRTFPVAIRATDDFDGDTGAVTFNFTVVEDATPMTLSYPDMPKSRVSYAITPQSPTVEHAVGNFSFAAPGLAQYGLAIEPRTGIVGGTPNATFNTTVTVTVTDKLGSSRAVTHDLHLISVPSPRVEVKAPVPGLYNRDILQASQPFAPDAEGTQAWTVSPLPLPQGLTLDASTGAFLGQPEKIGSFGPYTLTMTDSLPGSFYSAPFSFSVAMNDDPIEMASPTILTKVGFVVSTAVPTYDNNYGPPRFSSPELAALGLSVDPVTGVITGSVGTVYNGTPNIIIRDETLRTTSVPVNLSVLPRMRIVAPSSFSANAMEEMAPRKLTLQAVAGTVVWNPVDPAFLPPGMSFNTATGAFEGTPSEIGTWGPVRVTATDTFGGGQTDNNTSDPITINVIRGAVYVNLLSADLPKATKRTSAYNFDFKALVDPQTQGMDVSELSWATAGDMPAGLALDAATGVLSGTPTLSGSYDFAVTAAFNGKSATKSYHLDVVLPVASLTLASADPALPGAIRKVTGEDHSWSFDFATLLTRPNIPSSDVVYSVEPFAQGEALPVGLALTGGVLSGTADDKAGSYAFRVTASYVNGTDENYSSTAAYVLKVTDTIGIGLAAVEQEIGGKKRLSFSHEFGQQLENLKGVDASKLTWTMDVDPARDPATTMAEVPAGLAFEGSVLKGVPVNSGVYALVVTASFDGRSASQAYTIDIGLQTVSLALAGASLPGAQAVVPYANYEFGKLLTAQNIPANEVKWTATADVALGNGETAGLPPGLTLSPDTGVLSGTPGAKGTFHFKVSASWDDDDAVAEHSAAHNEYVVSVIGAAFVQISTGITHTCGVTAAGAAKCWGDNLHGQLGDGTTTNRSVPTQVSGLTSGVVSITAGTYFSCAVLADGSAKCWGWNVNGSLGDGTTTDRFVPTQVSGLTAGVRQIASGRAHTCAVLADGSAKCWGYNLYGNLGDGTKAAKYIPTQVSGLASGVVAVAAGYNHSCAVLADGSAKCWGIGNHGAIGDGTSTTSNLVPTQVSGLTSGVTAITTGNAFSCAVVNGSAKCWGFNQSGALGTGTVADSPTPTQVSGLTSGVAMIDAGDAHTCAILTNGSAKCWGDNSAGQLGDGTMTDKTVPGQVSGMISGVATISGGNSHTCAVFADSSAKCWGRDNVGQLGNGTTTQYVLLPTEVKG
jgi:alpha-tubulin suppressor-like RCC1 family protein